MWLLGPYLQVWLLLGPGDQEHSGIALSDAIPSGLCGLQLIDGVLFLYIRIEFVITTQ